MRRNMRPPTTTLLLALTLILAACGGDGETFMTVKSEAGFTVDLPEAWASEDATEDGFWFASSEDVLAAIVEDAPTTGAGGNIQIESTETLGTDDPVELLTQILGFFAADNEGLTVVSDAAAIAGHPQAAAKAQLRGDLAALQGDITTVVVIHEGRVAISLIVDTAEDGAHADHIQRIADSIRLQ